MNACSAVLLVIEPAPVSSCLCVGFYRKNIDSSVVSCRAVKDASEWSYHPTCTSPTSQPGRMEMGAPFRGVFEVGFTYVGSLGASLVLPRSLSTSGFCA